VCIFTLLLQARAARKAAAGAYLAAVSAAATRQDFQVLLQQLSSPTAAAEPAQQQQHMPWLLPAALTLAAKQLASGPGGKPEFAQALVELVLDQGIVETQRAQRAVHAVLQAYYDAGNFSGVSAPTATELQHCEREGVGCGRFSLRDVVHVCAASALLSSDAWPSPSCGMLLPCCASPLLACPTQALHITKSY
jgi:hypothetical protein